MKVVAVAAVASWSSEKSMEPNSQADSLQVPRLALIIDYASEDQNDHCVNSSSCLLPAPHTRVLNNRT